MNPESSQPVTDSQALEQLARQFATTLGEAIGRRLGGLVAPRQPDKPFFGGSAPASDASLHFALGGGPGSYPAAEAAGSIILSPDAAYGLLDLLLAGDGQLACTAESLSAMDRRMLGPVIGDAAAALGAAWPEEHAEFSPADATAAPPGELHWTAYPLEGRIHGTLWLGLCPRLLERLSPGGPAAELSVGIAERISTADLARAEPGDLLTTGGDTDELIVRIDGQDRFVASLGKYEGRRAITITRRLEQDPPTES